jgi:sucrose-6-phosphate hydrolase SacC (GH32 family)
VTLVIFVTFVTLEAFVTLVTFVTLEALVTLVTLVTFVTFVRQVKHEKNTITDHPSGTIGKVTKVHEMMKTKMTTTPTKNECQEGNGVVEKTKTGITTTEGSSYHVQEKTPRKDTTGIPRKKTIKSRHRQGTTDGSDRTSG